MKKLINILILIVAITAYVAIPGTFISCTDVAGDGIDSILYEGSTLPQSTSYRNPVWEPDLELGTIFKGPTNYVAIGSETQWAKGITYCAPTLISGNLMEWTFNSNTAFPLEPDTVIAGSETTIYKRPNWAEGRIHSMTAGFARTIVSTSYWLFYQIGDSQSIGAACARSPQGPYSDFGDFLKLTNTGSTSIKDPFFIVVGTRFYLLYTTEEGSYIQELTLRRNLIPTLRNAAVKISGTGFGDVAVYRKGDYFYIFGVVEQGGVKQINYARSTTIMGPYADVDGNELLTHNGTLLIRSGEQMINPENVSGIFADINDVNFILYSATDKSKAVQASGYNRRPLMLNKLTLNDAFWFDGTITPEIGWTMPKFADK